MVFIVKINECMKEAELTVEICEWMLFVVIRNSEIHVVNTTEKLRDGGASRKRGRDHCDDMSSMKRIQSKSIVTIDDFNTLICGNFTIFSGLMNQVHSFSIKKFAFFSKL